MKVLKKWLWLGCTFGLMQSVSLAQPNVAPDLSIDNQTNEFSTALLVNPNSDPSHPTGFCTASFSQKVGVTPPHTKHVINGLLLPTLCKYSNQPTNQCVALIYMTPDCSGKAIQKATLDLTAGKEKVSLESNFEYTGYTINQDEHNPFTFIITGGPSLRGGR